MARNREFDTGKVLEQALCLFWSNGYNGVSTQEMIDRFGISKSSLYGAFGDKQTLFLQVLEKYRDASAHTIISKLGHCASVKPTIREIFQELITAAFSDKDRKGCFIVNSAVELAPHDKAISKLIRQNRLAVKQAFVRAIRRGMASGEIPKNKDAENIGQLFCTALNGIYVDSRYHTDKKPYEDMVSLLMTMLD